MGEALAIHKCKRVIEMFSNWTVAEDTTQFEDNLSAPDTVLYQLVE